MTLQGTVRGRTIELHEQLPYAESRQVTVTVEPLSPAPKGSGRAIVQALRRLPPLEPGDIEAFEQAIEAGKLPLSPPISCD